MLQHVDNLEDALSASINKQQELSKALMKRVILRIQNLNLSAYLRTWAQKAFTSSNMYAGASIIETNLRHFIYRRSLLAILTRSIHVKQREIKRKKLAKFIMFRLRDSLISTFNG